MTLSIKHAFNSAVADSGNTALVQPSNWNAEHNITLAAGKVMGRDTSGAGAVQELPIAVDSSGNVGIGTSSPLSIAASRVYLSLKGTGTAANTGLGVLQFQSNAAGSTLPNMGNIEWALPDNSGSGSFRCSYISSSAEGSTANNYGSNLVFATKTDGVSSAGTERMRIDSSGNVGIGTSSPTAKLDLSSGNLNFSGTAQRITGDFTNATVASRVMFQTSTANSGTNISIIPNGTVGTGGGASHIRFEDNTSIATGNGSFGSALLVQGTDFRLSSTIAGTGTYLPITFYTGGSERMRIDTSGFVGIGTSSPSTLFEVANTSTTATITSTATSGYSVLSLRNTGTSGRAWQVAVGGSATAVAGSYYVYDATAAAVRMLIDSSGNVGIGATANASAILDAQSTTKGLRFPNMTTTQKNAISSPAAGLVVFDTTLAKLCVYSGSAWQTITSI